MSNFQKCPTCGEYGWFGAVYATEHKCPPAWECRLEWISDDPDAWEVVHAMDAEGAAAKYAERYDSTGGEYAIIRNGSCAVDVRKPQAGKRQNPSHRFNIEAESVPQYRASAA